MTSIISDLRYAGRELRRRPGFGLTAILSLALGIGATSAVFSVVYGVLINPFPYQGADRMMQIALRDSAGRFRYPGMSGAQLDQLRQARTVESVVGEDGWNLTTTDGDIPEDVIAAYISPNAPNHWGVAALMGRWLIPADAPPGQDPARIVVLGYQFWQRYYSGDPAVIGRTLQLVRKNYQIVGVMPPRFRWREADIYMPLKVRLEPNIYYGATLKIRPGVSTAEANAELQPLLQEFAKLTPERYPDSFRVNLRSIIEMYARPMGPRLFLLLGAVTSLLLVGCANVSILLLVRGAHRQQELAVPYTLKMRMFTQILVRTRVAPLSILRDVRAELVRVDREQQVMRVRDLQAWITGLPEYSQQQLVARLFGIFSILALALSAVGLYSVVSYGVATRTNEFGIRMALGARARDVVRLVMSDTSWNVGLGLLAGVVLCVAFDNIASRWVTESSRDPLILGGVIALLLTVAVIACLAPARRAASIDPMDAVRHN